jgi:hypothetical protein
MTMKPFPILTCFSLFVLTPWLWADDAPVSLADLPAYQTALTRSPDSPATPVAFRDLWEHPADYQGKQVRVEGRVERVFRQEPIGKLPALAEAWLFTPDHNPICLVFPDAPVELGASVAFSGDYVRRIRYGAADVERLAPLIVGPRAPLLLQPASPAASQNSDRSGLNLMFLLIAVLILASGLLRAFLRRPRPVQRLDSDPDPIFDDGPPV